MERLQPSGIDVLVVGAGIGGLSAAIELWRKGHDVRVIEAKDGIAGLGDFVGIGVSATRQFAKWLGTSEHYDKICYKPALSLYTYEGELFGGPWPARRIDAVPTPVSRPSLIRLLYDLAVSVGVKFCFGQKVVEYYEDSDGVKFCFGQKVVEYYEDSDGGRAGVLTASGAHHYAELVVAADGVGSRSSKIVMGNDSPPRSSGFAVYRVAFPTAIAHQDKEVATNFPVPTDGSDDVRIYLGPNTHAITIVSEKIITWLLTHEDKGHSAESWSSTVNASDVIQELAKDPSWDPRLLALIKQTPDQSTVDWKLMWRNANPTWASPGMRIIQLGDAAHTFLPTSANGATQAVEDGISLASCLHLAGKDNIALGLRVHNHLRFQRVSCCQRAGFKNREQWHHVDLKEARKHPEKLAEMTGRWITSHDPEEYAYQNWTNCVNHLIRGTEFVNTNIPPGFSYRPWTIDELLNAADEGRVVDDDGDWS
ncbi:monooxygenase [Aspergillus keveii]|uniref:Monooxygenase n=1 Tax=Aspergillus keveii TaxID=714993 RepID=A0ABR4FMU6_9EURO